MPTSDKITHAEQQLTEIAALVASEEYTLAVAQVEQLHQDVLQLFATPSTVQQHDAARLQHLASNFSSLVSTLSNQREQIKDSIGHIAAVKSAKKISKTYKID